MNLYEILDVDQNADLATIKKAYKAQASILHPDKPTGDAEKFKRLQGAYSILKDPVSRERYDLTGAVDNTPTQEEKAVLIIVQIMNQAMEQHAYVKKDYFKLIRAALREQLSQLKENIRQQEVIIANYNYLVENMVAPVNVVHNLGGKALELNNRLSAMHKDVSDGEAALKLVADCLYKGEVYTPPKVNINGGSFDSILFEAVMNAQNDEDEG